MPQHTILIAIADDHQRAHLATHLDADGHTVYAADAAASTTAKLTVHPIDVLVLGELERPAQSLALLRELRAGQLHLRVHPAQPVITLGADDHLSAVHAYEAGSDHHLTAGADYLVVRAVVAAITRRTVDSITSRHVHIGDLHIDTAARTVDVNERRVKLSKLEFDLLAKLASDPSRVFTKPELLRSIWGAKTTVSRTLDSHACRLRRRLSDAGSPHTIQNLWGTGYRLGTNG